MEIFEELESLKENNYTSKEAKVYLEEKGFSKKEIANNISHFYRKKSEVRNSWLFRLCILGQIFFLASIYILYSEGANDLFYLPILFIAAILTVLFFNLKKIMVQIWIALLLLFTGIILFFILAGRKDFWFIAIIFSFFTQISYSFYTNNKSDFD